mmetsp:Transcript_8203/g.19384  ORF Transcript_8203/g.19384 Transcript_8203/m.19384 type:complete len:162 (+) Transcript_8203:435-920(+)
MGAVLGYWLWNAAAWAYAYRVLGVEAERVLADRDHQGSVEVELHMKSFSPRGETRSPDLSEVKAKTEGRWSRGGGGGGTASSIDSPYDSPYRTPVEPRRVLVLPYFVNKPEMAGQRGPRGRLTEASRTEAAGPRCRPGHRLALAKQLSAFLAEPWWALFST